MPEARRIVKVIQDLKENTDLIVIHETNDSLARASATFMCHTALGCVKAQQVLEWRTLDNSTEGKNIILMLPSDNFSFWLESIYTDLLDLAISKPNSVSLGAVVNNHARVLPHVKLDNLISLVELQRELTHAENVNHALKNFFIGPDKRVPMGSVQSAQANQTQTHHAIYLNSLQVLVDMLGNDDLASSIITLPATAETKQ